MSSLKVPAEPSRPAITPAQILAFLVAGVPVLANLLHVFGVYDLSPEQQDALTSTMQWALGVGGALALGDAYLRGKRNDAHASVTSAALHAASYLPPMAVAAEPDFDPDNDPDEDGSALYNEAPVTSFVADPKDKRS